MPWSVGVGGAHRAVAAMWVGVGGVWRAVTRADVGVGAAWRIGFNAVSLASNYSITHNAFSPASATAGWRLKTNGDIERIRGAVVDTIGTWTTAGVDTSIYEAVVTVTSGSLSSGPTGTTNLGGDRTWLRQQSGFGNSSVTFTLVIRLAGGGATLDSTSVQLTADVSI